MNFLTLSVKMLEMIYWEFLAIKWSELDWIETITGEAQRQTDIKDNLS